jgi:metal-responsive CopG/Arc/MetJ family transcriptional regulator
METPRSTPVMPEIGVEMPRELLDEIDECHGRLDDE